MIFPIKRNLIRNIIFKINLPYHFFSYLPQLYSFPLLNLLYKPKFYKMFVGIPGRFAQSVNLTMWVDLFVSGIR